MWIARFGNQPQGKVGALLNELVRNLAFETALQLSEDEEPAHSRPLERLGAGDRKSWSAHPPSTTNASAKSSRPPWRVPLPTSKPPPIARAVR